MSGTAVGQWDMQAEDTTSDEVDSVIQAQIVLHTYMRKANWSLLNAGYQGQLSDFSDPNHQSPKKRKSYHQNIIVKYYKSVDNHFHAALWSCRERFTCLIYSQSPITQFLQGPITMRRKCMYSP